MFKNWSRIAGLMMLMTVALTGVTQALDVRPLCEVCRRYTDTAPSRVQAVIEIGDHRKGLDLCSVFCFCERMEDYDQEPLYCLVLDYATYESDNEQLVLRADYATYLFDASGDEQKSHEPFIYAFSDEETAETYQSELGGEILDWESILEECTELAQEWEPEEGESYTPLMKGRRPR